MASKPVPTVPGAPGLGLLAPFLRDRMGTLERISSVHGEIVRFPVGPFRLVLLNAPELVEEVLVRRAYDFPKSRAEQTRFRALIGDALNVQSGAAHDRQRKIVAPVFQPRRMEHYADGIVASVHRIQVQWPEDTPFELLPALRRMSFGLIGRALLGRDGLDAADPLWIAINAVTAYLDSRSSSVVSLPLGWPTPYNLRMQRHFIGFRRVIEAEVQARHARPGEHEDLLAQMVQVRSRDGGALEDSQLCGMATVSFLAGFDNIAAALAWTFILLSRHPEVYAHLLREIDEVLAGQPPSYADVARLKYSTWTLKEALRIYPLAPLLARQPASPTTVGDYRVGKGDILLISPYLLHRKSETFPEPERFQPERFAAEGERALPRCAYLPFGAGPQSCIGSHFSMMACILALALLSQHWRLDPAPATDIEAVHGSIMRPPEGVLVTARRRPTPFENPVAAIDVPDGTSAG